MKHQEIFYYFYIDAILKYLHDVSGGSRISRRRGEDLVWGGGGGGGGGEGGAKSQGSYISKNLYVKTKESGPLGGARRQRPHGSANGCICHDL